MKKAFYILAILLLLSACGKRQEEVNLSAERPKNALFEAAKAGDIDKVKELLKHGADVNAIDKEGHTPLDVALTHCKSETVVLLREHGAETEKVSVTVAQAARYWDTAKVEELLAAGAEVNSREGNDWTALNFAIAKGDLDLVQLLIDHDADLTLGDCEEPLHLAAQKGHRDIVELLIDSGADINSEVFYDKAPLHLAVEWRQKEVAQLLLAKGCKVNTKDIRGNTALDKAHSEEMKELLRAHGAVSGEEVEEREE